MDIHEIAYLAGIIDGEGCISLAKRKGIYVTPTLQVTNTDSRLTDWLKKSLGGNIYRRREQRANRKQCFLWSIAGAKARMIIKTLRPYLLLKGEQADIILALETADRTLIPRDGTTGRLIRLPQTYHDTTAAALKAIRALNRRGVYP